MKMRNYYLFALIAAFLPLQLVTAQDNENVLEEVTVTGSRAGVRGDPRQGVHRFL